MEHGVVELELIKNETHIFVAYCSSCLVEYFKQKKVGRTLGLFSFRTNHSHF